MLVMIEEIERKIVVDVTRESLMCGSLPSTPFFFFPIPSVPCGDFGVSAKL